jgi:molybdopterin synthase catalytic subunit
VTARQHTALTEDPLSLDAAARFCADPGAGATLLFTGAVRGHAHGLDVIGLTYEAYCERAKAQLDTLADELAGEWSQSLLAVWLEHRLGELSVGQVSVVVAVSAAHRAEAFEAARAGIERLKHRVAIWKQEHWATGGSHWLGLP